MRASDKCATFYLLKQNLLQTFLSLTAITVRDLKEAMLLWGGGNKIIYEYKGFQKRREKEPLTNESYSTSLIAIKKANKNWSVIKETFLNAIKKANMKRILFYFIKFIKLVKFIKFVKFMFEHVWTCFWREKMVQ